MQFKKTNDTKIIIKGTYRQINNMQSFKKISHFCVTVDSRTIETTTCCKAGGSGWGKYM